MNDDERDDGVAAFPIIATELNYDDIREQYYPSVYVKDAGMTLRDYFAGQALLMMARWHAGNCEEIARDAYKTADAMLAERAKGG